MCEKQELRGKLRRRRKRAFEEDQAHGGVAAAQLAEMAQALVQQPLPSVVSGYMPISNEIDPRPLMAVFANAGAHLCLPEVVDKGTALIFRGWTPGDLMSSGKLGTLQPLAEVEELVPEFLIVPVLGVDNKGVRLGQGGGFYDRTLAKLRGGGDAGDVRAIGVAFDEQIVDELPCEPHDQLLDGLVTPTSVVVWDERRQRSFLAQR